jgi:hypothetical protein
MFIFDNILLDSLLAGHDFSVISFLESSPKLHRPTDLARRVLGKLAFIYL